MKKDSSRSIYVLCRKSIIVRHKLSSIPKANPPPIVGAAVPKTSKFYFALAMHLHFSLLFPLVSLLWNRSCQDWTPPWLCAIRVFYWFIAPFCQSSGSNPSRIEPCRPLDLEELNTIQTHCGIILAYSCNTKTKFYVSKYIIPGSKVL